MRTWMLTVFLISGCTSQPRFADEQSQPYIAASQFTSSTSVSLDIQKPVKEVFDYVTAEGVLVEVLRDYYPHDWGAFRGFRLPGVAGTKVLMGDWVKEGSERVVYLNDGETAKETILIRHEPQKDYGYYSYRVDRFSGATGKMVEEAVGQWFFEPAPKNNGMTRLFWRYTFKARGSLMYRKQKLMVRYAWHGYMKQAIDLIKSNLEAR